MRRDVVFDNFFVETAQMRLFRASGTLDPFLGGLYMGETFQYDRVNGGAYRPGSELQVTQKQILAAAAFTPRAYEETIPLNQWQTEVINSGPQAIVSIADAYMSNAVQALSTDFNIDFYRHGQPSASSPNGTAGVANDRSIYINGASEAVNNGIDPSWDGNYFTSYGGQLRNGAVTSTLNATVTWAGDQTGNTGQVSYKLLLEAYLNAVEEPTAGLCNKALYAYIAERQESKQRFGDITKGENTMIGMTGFKMMNAWIHVDKLAPSTRFGTLLPQGLSQTTAISPVPFTTPATVTSISGLPASTSVNPGEVFFWFRIPDWKVRPPSSPLYNHYFTPPIYSQTNADLVVIFYRCGMNMYTPQPRNNSQIYGCGF